MSKPPRTPPNREADAGVGVATAQEQHVVVVEIPLAGPIPRSSRPRVSSPRERAMFTCEGQRAMERHMRGVVRRWPWPGNEWIVRTTKVRLLRLYLGLSQLGGHQDDVVVIVIPENPIEIIPRRTGPR